MFRTKQNPNFGLPDFCVIFGQVVQKFRHFLVVSVCVEGGGGGGGGCDKVQAIVFVIQFFIHTAI